MSLIPLHAELTLYGASSPTLGLGMMRGGYAHDATDATLFETAAQRDRAVRRHPGAAGLVPFEVTLDVRAVPETEANTFAFSARDAWVHEASGEGNAVHPHPLLFTIATRAAATSWAWTAQQRHGVPHQVTPARKSVTSTWPAYAAALEAKLIRAGTLAPPTPATD